VMAIFCWEVSVCGIGVASMATPRPMDIKAVLIKARGIFIGLYRVFNLFIDFCSTLVLMKIIAKKCLLIKRLFRSVSVSLTWKDDVSVSITLTLVTFTQLFLLS